MAEIESISKIIEEISPYYKKKKGPSEEHKIIYDSGTETLEPIYFWIVDFMNGMFQNKVEKLLDNFASSPGGGHFAEIGQRATIMQQQASQTMGNINTVLKSILNLIYDLREFQLRLSQYKAASSSDDAQKEAGFLALKQIWMDNVDIKRGRGSINMLAQDLQFVTIRDAFMAAKSVNDIKKFDLNEKVKRILEPRMLEFLEWKNKSEIELKKRYEIEKNYLKSQVASLKLYTRWAKPYLRAAEQLRMMEGKRSPELVNVFNTIVLELTLMGKSDINVEGAVVDKSLPQDFKKMKFPRKYYSCVLVDFHFRGIPQRIPSQQSHYVFGGRAEVTFKGYALNEDELKMLNQKLEQSDLEEALKLVEGTTSESLGQIKGDIDEFLKDNEEEIKKKSEGGSNPFLALFGFYDKGSEEKKKEEKPAEKKIESVSKDNYAESVVRELANKGAREMCFSVFDIYKKAHGMESHPAPEF